MRPGGSHPSCSRSGVFFVQHNFHVASLSISLHLPYPTLHRYHCSGGILSYFAITAVPAPCLGFYCPLQVVAISEGIFLIFLRPLPPCQLFAFQWLIPLGLPSLNVGVEVCSPHLSLTRSPCTTGGHPACRPARSSDYEAFPRCSSEGHGQEGLAGSIR